MKKHVVRAAAAVFAAALLVTAALAAGAGETVYQNKRTLLDGYTYINTVYLHDSWGREESYALGDTLGNDVYPIVCACDRIYGGMTLDAATDYAESIGYNVVGGINTDFFSTSTGVPMGVVIENGILKSGSRGRNALCFDEYGQAFVSENALLSIELANAATGKNISVSHFNKYRSDTGGVYLYSEYYSTVSTRTYTDGWFVRLKIISGEDVAVSGALELEVTEKLRSDEAVPIGEGFLVLTAADECGYGEVYDSFELGDKITLSVSCSDGALANAKWATGCGDVLAYGGSLTGDDGWDDPSGVHPRSAVGIKPDGTVLYYVVDGRDEDYSNGLSLTAVAEELTAQGCDTVVNMDGGGSSAICAPLPGADGNVCLNSPSDGFQRSCSTYILLVTDEPSTGDAQRLYLGNDGAAVMTGSSLELKVTAADGALGAAAAPENTVITAQNGSVNGTTYTAGSKAGMDSLTLDSAEASGVGSVWVVASPTDIAAYPRSCEPEPGETVEITAQPLWHNMELNVDASQIKYEVVGNIGTVTDGGVFRAAGERGAEGAVRVSCGDAVCTINVRIKERFTDIRGHWGKEYIEKLADAGIINGVDDMLFAPESNIKRADFMLMLYRAAGEPSITPDGSFTDVSEDAYYAGAVAWARQTGIAEGMGDGTFAPEARLTREQAFTFAVRFMGVIGKPVITGDTALLRDYPDGGDVQDYARVPTATLISMGVVSGSDGYLLPSASLTRAQTAKIICIVLYG